MAGHGSADDLADFSLLGGLTVQGGLAYASADFQDAQETWTGSTANLESLGGNRDAVQGIVHQTLTRHLTEALPPAASPGLSSFTLQRNNWRKSLREMMIRQNETLLAFLLKPQSDHAVVGPVENALRRYAIREDVDVSTIRPLKNLLTDISGGLAIQAEIEACVRAKGGSSLADIRSQVNALLELYKETGEKLLDCENQLKMRLEKMDKIQKRVGMIMELKTNEATGDLITSLEKYLQVAFREMTIEPLYKSLLHLYQKHIALREAIAVFKTGTQLVNEPMCAICITDPVSMAIVPCGHTFCATCARRMTMECGVCRGRIRERMKLYFS